MYSDRLNGILSEQEFYYMQDYAEEYMSEFLNNKVFLYKVDKQRTTSSENFDETTSKDIFFEDPVEIPCIVEIKPQENKAYSDNQTARYEEYGNLIFSCLELTLKKKNIIIEYGDHVAYNIKGDFIFFEIINTDTKNISNNKTFLGFEPMWKLVECTPTNQNKIMQN